MYAFEKLVGAVVLRAHQNQNAGPSRRSIGLMEAVQLPYRVRPVTEVWKFSGKRLERRAVRFPASSGHFLGNLLDVNRYLAEDVVSVACIHYVALQAGKKLERP